MSKQTGLIVGVLMVIGLAIVAARLAFLSGCAGDLKTGVRGDIELALHYQQFWILSVFATSVSGGIIAFRTTSARDRLALALAVVLVGFAA